MRNIVVGYDGSRNSHVALQQALHLVESTDLRVRVVHAIEPVGPEQQPEVVEETDVLAELDKLEEMRAGEQGIAIPQEDVLDRAAALCEEYTADCSFETSHGMAADVLTQHALGADLLIVGRRGRTGRGVIGRTASELIRRPRVPVLLCGEEFLPVKRLLLAYEPTEEGGRALNLAADLSADMNVTVDVLVAEESRRDAEKNLDHAETMLGPHLVQAQISRSGTSMSEALESVAPETRSSVVLVSDGKRNIWPWSKSDTVQIATELSGALPLIVP